MQSASAWRSMIVKALEGKKMGFFVLLEWPCIAVSVVTGIQTPQEELIDGISS